MCLVDEKFQGMVSLISYIFSISYNIVLIRGSQGSFDEGMFTRKGEQIFGLDYVGTCVYVCTYTINV